MKKMKNLFKKDQNDLTLPLTILHSADPENLAHLFMGGSNGIWTCGRPLTTCVKKGTIAVFKTNLDSPGGSNFYVCGTFLESLDWNQDQDLGWPNPEVGGDKYAYKINIEFRAIVPRDVMYKHIRDWKDSSIVSNKTLGQTTGKCLIGASSLQKLIKEYGF
jgi:hypothetical protein